MQIRAQNVTRNTHPLRPSQDSSARWRVTNPLNLISSRSVRVGKQSLYYGVPVAKNRTFKIVNWVEFQCARFKKYGKAFNKGPFGRCPYANCQITANTSLYSEADAVLVHMNSDVVKKKLMKVPAVRPKGQIWIALNREPALHSSVRLHRELSGVFHAHYSFQREADIYWPYAYHYSRHRKKTTGYKPDRVNVTRPKLVAWMVSHCKTHSRREDYVTALQKHIDVDIYGKCGPLNCSRKQNCYAKLARTYKFYLSFENSLCTDYISEKAWNILKLNIVPVVMGGANYTQLLPPHSFIDVRDFKSPRHLAEYLKMLSKNDKLYREYLQWKTHYKIVSTHFQLTCQICAFMNKDYKLKLEQKREHPTFIDLDYLSDERKHCFDPQYNFTKNE